MIKLNGWPNPYGALILPVLMINLLTSCAAQPHAPSSSPPLHKPTQSSKIIPSGKPPQSLTLVSTSTPSPSYNKSYTVRGKTYYPMRSAVGYKARGIASWYGSEISGLTAMGTPFDPQGLTAAHKTLPLPAKVRVTNLSNGLSVDVVVNDRGPFKKDRLIDLSQGAAKMIGLDTQGLIEVEIEYLEMLADNP